MDVTAQEVDDSPPWCMLFADDIVLCHVDRGVVEQKSRGLEESYGRERIEDQQEENRILELNEDCDREIKQQRTKLNQVGKFKYLGSTVTEDSALEAWLGHRIQYCIRISLTGDFDRRSETRASIYCIFSPIDLNFSRRLGCNPLAVWKPPLC